ncbi:MAG: DUF4139 domain-containing protein [Bacteroidia bacterium]|nr:DUF4139 domain-containing protein [Bacteroidia bacterium]
MKKVTMIILLVLSMMAFAEEVPEVNSEPKPYQVTVFLTGAELRYHADLNLQKGKNLVKFTNLSAKLDPGSIIVDINKKSAVILSVFSGNNFLQPVPDNTKIRPIRDSIELVKDELALLRGRKDALTQEKELLSKNDAILGKDKGQPASETEKSADFFRKRITDINMELYKIGKQEVRWSQRLDLLSKQYNELNLRINPPSSEVSVLLLAGEGGSCGFDLKYRVADAGWTPKYDIRVEGVTKPVEMLYKANIFNNTGVDWVNVKLKLSTADPRMGAQYPKLDDWSFTGEQRTSEENANYSYQQSQIVQLKKDNANVEFKMVEVDELNAEFDIALPYTIPSDSKPYLVDVNNKMLDARYEYVSVPKMDKDAFLIAKVVGWTDLNLVSGNASIYFNGTYIGQSRINVREISDTLELSLGRDSKIAISRVKKSERNDRQIIGNYEKETFKYEITVKNNRESTLTLSISDQVPMDNDSRIDIHIAELSGGIYDKPSGQVTWKLTLQPGEVKTINFNFSVKYPKSMKPKKKKYRTISSPSF